MDPHLRDHLRNGFRWTDPGPHSDVLVSDRSGWWRDPVLLRRLGPALAGMFADAAPGVVVSPEVTGFLLGPLVACELQVGFVEAYRAGARRPLAEAMTWADVPVDHRGEAQRIGVRDRLLTKGDRVLVVDDWVATGAQARALCTVVRALGAEPVGVACIVATCPAPVAAELTVRSLLTDADLADAATTSPWG